MGFVSRYRQSTMHEPGKVIKHYGLADDPVKKGPFGYVPQTVNDDVSFRSSKAALHFLPFGFGFARD